MKRFKKRTIALVLASVITVVGSFAAENYKNSLMALEFEGESGGVINLQVQTRTAYDGNVVPIKKDSNTYVLMLPEMDSKASAPDLQKVSGGIESVNIRTMPYSSSGKGYTRVTIKTAGVSTSISATKKVYIPADTVQPALPDINKSSSNVTVNNDKPANEVVNSEEQSASVEYKENSDEENAQQNSNQSREGEQPQDSQSTVDSIQQFDLNSQPTKQDNYDAFLFVMGISLLIIVIIYLYVKAKNKMQELAGSEKYDIEDKIENTSNGKLKKIKTTIKKLDSVYTNPALTKNSGEYQNNEVKNVSKRTDLNIVDLDELYKEQSTSQVNNPVDNEEENAALEEFLNGFSFDEEIQEEQPSFDEDLFNSIINNGDIRFTKGDIDCINELLNIEILDSTLQNISEYAVSCPVELKPSKSKMLENLMVEYSISQNVTFKQKDVDALEKLINVELDSSFIEDLKTNHERTVEMEKEVENPSEYSTCDAPSVLQVKDILPNLSEELIKQGKKPIESEVKPQTVYYSEGYDVNILSTMDVLPDLSSALNKNDAYAPQPSARVEIADESFNLAKLEIDDELPDLQDAINNPQKYDNEKEEKIVDEATLLKNISDVRFKPFYDSNENPDNIEFLEEALSVAAVKKELTGFDNFEISEEKTDKEVDNIQDDDDFETLFNEEFIDSKDKSQNESKIKGKPHVINVQQSKQYINTNSVLKRNEQKRQNRPQNALEQSPKCILDGNPYIIIKTNNFTQNTGCYLAKNENGYNILGFVSEKIVHVKHYDKLKNENMHSRISEKLTENKFRYLVKVAGHKIVLEVTDNSIEYVMDLC
jgi:hypothetical protein